MRATSPVVHWDPSILGGTLVLAGTGVPVRTLLDYLQAGNSLHNFLTAFPSVTREQALDALELAEVEQVVRFSPAAFLLLFLPLGILFGISVLINPQAWGAATWEYGVIGGVVLFILSGCIVLRRRCFLRLTPKGLSIHYLTSERHYSWDEVRHFRVAEGPAVKHMPTGRRIVFDLTEDSTHRTGGVRAVAGINGYDVSILDSFSFTAEELVDVLREWQRLFIVPNKAAAADPGASCLGDAGSST